MKAVITGGAGFIGSHMSEALLKKGYEVTIIDNFSTGRLKFLSKFEKKIELINADLKNPNCEKYFVDTDIVFHFSANADVRFGLNHPKRDLEENTLVTFNVLEAMRKNNCKEIVFSSTGSVYGEAEVFPTPENAPFPIQTSLYGASKLACEGLISSYCEGFNFKARIYRFVSILGERYSHGHVFDFIKQLQNDPHNLTVLGNGKQKKSYLNVKDCINAILHSKDFSKQSLEIYNLGTNEYCEVMDSVDWICGELSLNPHITTTGGERGWVGDNPFIFLDTKKISSTGWQPEFSIEDSIKETALYLIENKWLLS